MLLSAEMLRQFEKEHGLWCKAFSLTTWRGDAYLTQPTRKAFAPSWDESVGQLRVKTQGKHIPNTDALLLLYKAKSELKG